MHISDLSTAKYKSEKEIEAAKEVAGISYGEWFNDKVVFGYNYVDVNTVLKEEDKRSHGMHVTSIATGNPTQPVAGQLMYGVAPEAQVMFMRVFSDLKATTGAALYVKAIEDAVKLGADSINLSLGGANGSVVNMNENVTAAIEAARRAGFLLLLQLVMMEHLVQVILIRQPIIQIMAWSVHLQQLAMQFLSLLTITQRLVVK